MRLDYIKKDCLICFSVRERSPHVHLPVTNKPIHGRPCLHDGKYRNGPYVFLWGRHVQFRFPPDPPPGSATALHDSSRQIGLVSRMLLYQLKFKSNHPFLCWTKNYSVALMFVDHSLRLIDCNNIFTVFSLSVICSSNMLNGITENSSSKIWLWASFLYLYIS